jgi:Uma2 family endonuclease/predicted nucleic acid-binding protein
MTALLDTNVLLDVFLAREPWAADAAELWRACEEGRLTARISALTVPNIFYIIRKIAGLDRATQCVEICLDTFEVCAITAETLRVARDLRGNDFEDSDPDRLRIARWTECHHHPRSRRFLCRGDTCSQSAGSAGGALSNVPDASAIPWERRFRRLPLNNCGRCPQDRWRELVRGKVHELPFHGFANGEIILKVGVLLSRCATKHRSGVVVAGGVGFVLARDPDTVRGVDVGFVRASRIPASGRPVQFWEGAPDLAVEVVSPSDTMEEVEEKVDDYLTAGTSAVWVVNPRRRSVTVHRTATNPIILRENDMLDGQDVVVGFQCKVAQLFV